MAVGDPYVTRDEFKDRLDITTTDEDDWIDRCVRGASRALERRSGWPTFWKSAAPETRVLNTAGRALPIRSSYARYTKVLLPDGIASATGFAISGFSAPVLMPEDALGRGVPADAIRLSEGSTFGNYGTIEVTAIWGWPEVPDDILWAAQMQAHRYYRRKGSPEGIAGSAEWGLSRVPRLDPDVLGVLKDGNYMKPGIG